MTRTILLALLLSACGAESLDGAVDAPEGVGGESAIESTGGAVVSATGGAAANSTFVAATGGATIGTGGAKATGGAVATGGSVATGGATVTVATGGLAATGGAAPATTWTAPADCSGAPSWPGVKVSSYAPDGSLVSRDFLCSDSRGRGYCAPSGCLECEVTNPGYMNCDGDNSNGCEAFVQDLPAPVSCAAYASAHPSSS